jgi:hypothetical protein
MLAKSMLDTPEQGGLTTAPNIEQINISLFFLKSKKGYAQARAL